MHVLIIKTSALGDILHAFSVIEYLHHHFSNIKIDWVVEERCEELIRFHPKINHIHVINTRQWNAKITFSFIKELRQQSYDVVFDLQGNIKSGLITLFSRAKNKVGFGFKTAPEWPNCLTTRTHFNPPKGLNIRNDLLHLVKSYFKDNSGFETNIENITTDLFNVVHKEQKLEALIKSEHLFVNQLKVMVCPGSMWPNKQLPLSILSQFLERLTQSQSAYFFFTWGTTAEKKLATELNSLFSNSYVLDKCSLPSLQQHMQRMDLIISMDSLPLHLAGTTQTPTYAIFGPSSKDKYNPLSLHNGAFQGDCPFNKVFEKRCPVLRSCESGACIKGISSEKLFFHFQEWWNQLKRF